MTLWDGIPRTLWSRDKKLFCRVLNWSEGIRYSQTPVRTGKRQLVELGQRSGRPAADMALLRRDTRRRERPVYTDDKD